MNKTRQGIPTRQGVARALLALALAWPVAAIEPPAAVRPIPPREVEEDVAPPRDPAPPRAIPRAEPAPPGAGPREPVREERPYIGVIIDPVPELVARHLQLAPGEGVVIGELVGGGPAERAGLEVDDIITRVDGQVVGSAEQVRDVVAPRAVGERVTLDVIKPGERRELELELGAAPRHLPQAAVPQAGMEEMLGGLPEKHAERMRQQLEQGLRAFEEQRPEFERMQREMLQRMERGLRQFDFNELEELFPRGGGIQLDMLDEALPQAGIQAESSIRLLDDEGSIEMRSRNGEKSARVFDEAGELLWEGPYETEEDIAAAPPEVRDRLDRLDLKLNFGRNSMQLRFGPQRFRQLPEIEEQRRSR